MLIAISYTVLLVVPAVGEQARFARCSIHLVTVAFSSCTSNYVVSLSMQLHYSTKKNLGRVRHAQCPQSAARIDANHPDSSFGTRRAARHPLRIVVVSVDSSQVAQPLSQYCARVGHCLVATSACQGSLPPFSNVVHHCTFSPRLHYRSSIF